MAKENIGRPERYEVRQLESGGLEIRWRWINGSVFFFIPFALVWNGFLVKWYSLAYRPGQGGDLFPLLFPLGHVAVGIFLVYFIAATLLNRTRVSVDMTHVWVKHGPLPWRGNRVLVRNEIEQFYCVERIRQGKNSRSANYDLMLRKRSGVLVPLLSGLKTHEEALFVETTLERYLGIRDQSMPGEKASY